MGPPFVGPAVFLVSAAVLATQVVLLRIFSIQSFHHFAYMAIGMALLGFGASGTLMVLLEDRLRQRLQEVFEALCVAFPVVLVLGVWASGEIPFEPTQLLWDSGQWILLALTYLVLTAPFLTAAAALGVALMGAKERIGRIYAWNMVGAGLGSGLALGLLALWRPDRALGGVVIVSALGAAAAILRRGSRIRRALATLVVVGAAVVALRPPWTLTITPFKGLPQVEAFPGARRISEAWGPTGWAVSVAAPAFRHGPGLSLAYTGSLPPQSALFVDAETAGAAFLGEPDGPGALAFLDWLPSAAVYGSGSPERVLVLGSGGGLEVLSARFHGARAVTDVELVRPLVQLRRSALETWMEGGTSPRHRTVVGDARTFLESTEERYDAVVLPVSGVMPAAAAGVYSLGEDYLNTVHAYRAFLRSLAPGGTVAMTRWLRTPPRDNVRMILTAAAALRAEGTHDVGGALVFVRSWATGTLLVKPRGFEPGEVEALRRFAVARRFDLDWPRAPGVQSFNAIERPVYAEAASAAARGVEAARHFADAYPFRVDPPTDDRPYFGRFLRARTIPELVTRERGAWLPFAEWGTLAVMATLIQSGLLALVLVGLPGWVLAARGGGRDAARSAAYFGALGFGYVFLEMGAIQRLGLLLGHPVYATAATLATLLAFSGVGSAVSDRVDARWGPRVCLGIAALLAVATALVAVGAGAVSGLPLALRIVVGLGIVAVPAFLMGAPFPLGLRALAGGTTSGVAWAWATNGVASVMGASLAILVAMEVGGTGLLALAAALYVVAATLSWPAVRGRTEPAVMESGAGPD